MLELIARYFDLNYKNIRQGDAPTAKGLERREWVKKGALSAANQFLLYFGVLFGVILSDFINNEGLTKPRSYLVSGIVALLTTPSVYDKLNLAGNKSNFLARLAIFVQSGMAWQQLGDLTQLF